MSTPNTPHSQLRVLGRVNDRLQISGFKAVGLVGSGIAKAYVAEDAEEFCKRWNHFDELLSALKHAEKSLAFCGHHIVALAEVRAAIKAVEGEQS